LGSDARNSLPYDLIRSRRDTGIVVILDPRVRTKSYGKEFLASLPNCRLVVEKA
jgi:ATP-dependent DNA helicase DinG